MIELLESPGRPVHCRLKWNLFFFWTKHLWVKTRSAPHTSLVRFILLSCPDYFCILPYEWTSCFWKSILLWDFVERREFDMSDNAMVTSPSCSEYRKANSYDSSSTVASSLAVIANSIVRRYFLLSASDTPFSAVIMQVETAARTCLHEVSWHTRYQMEGRCVENCCCKRY